MVVGVGEEEFLWPELWFWIFFTDLIIFLKENKTNTKFKFNSTMCYHDSLIACYTSIIINTIIILVREI